MTEAKNPLRNILKSEFPYKGHIIDVRVDTVKFPSGAEKLREVVLHSPAVAMLAEDADGGIFLVKQYRHAVDEEIYEIPRASSKRASRPRRLRRASCRRR